MSRYQAFDVEFDIDGPTIRSGQPIVRRMVVGTRALSAFHRDEHLLPVLMGREAEGTRTFRLTLKVEEFTFQWWRWRWATREVHREAWFGLFTHRLRDIYLQRSRIEGGEDPELVARTLQQTEELIVRRAALEAVRMWLTDQELLGLAEATGLPRATARAQPPHGDLEAFGIAARTYMDHMYPIIQADPDRVIYAPGDSA